MLRLKILQKFISKRAPCLTIEEKADHCAWSSALCKMNDVHLEIIMLPVDRVLAWCVEMELGRVKSLVATQGVVDLQGSVNDWCPLHCVFLKKNKALWTVCVTTS